MAIAQTRLTLEEFLKLPEEKPALEYIDGLVVQKVSPKFLHALMQLTLMEFINAFARPRRLALALPELRAVYGGQATVPDVAVYVWERIRRRPDGSYEQDYFIPPDIAIEITSPSQTTTSLVRKCLWYVANGVRIALLVDPDDLSVLLFRPSAIPLALSDGEPIDLADVLPGFELTPDQLFAALRAE